MNSHRRIRLGFAAVADSVVSLLAVMIGVATLAVAPSAFAQSNSGELRLRVTDPSGLPLRASIQLDSEANHYSRTLATNESGNLTVPRLPFGLYQLTINLSGFAAVSEQINIRYSIPVERAIQLQLSRRNESVKVAASATLLETDQAGSVSQVGSDLIENRLGSIPGRGLHDLVNSQPGWLYEGNAVLHPRGSEYQTQIVVDSIPLTDNRSPSFGPEFDDDDIQSMTIYTAGIPAEYGRKMGGVVEVSTIQDPNPGLHGRVVLSGGSFDSAGAFAEAQYVWGKNSFGGSASGSETSHYLNPVVPQNFNNTGTLGDFSLNYQRQLTTNDRLFLSVRHEISRYEIPNELVQQAAGQDQTADNLETMGILSYQHTFSPNAVADLHLMIRDNTNDFSSNPQSTPVEVFQHNWFREAYAKGAATIDHGHHEFRFGVETDNLFLNENLRYHITDLSQFDNDTPINFAFAANHPDLEQAVFFQDLVRLGNWTINAGLRYDHYQLILNRQAVDPRFAISRYFPRAGLVLHFSYDRVFQTPSFENILLSSSTAVDSLSPDSFLRLPVQPSQGNYYEVGAAKVFFNKVKLDVNYFRRLVSQYADDDQIDNTAISFPIAFRKAILYGAEARLDVPNWWRFSGYLSYSYIVGNAWLPVTGGLFLGDDASAAETQLTGHFPDSQDQRHTVRGRVRYQLTPRFWLASGIQYDTGLPFEFDGDPDSVLAQYGPQVLSRINFARGRIYPSFQVSASAGAQLYHSERLDVHFQIDGENLTNVLDVIDFGGLFSGNAIGPSRSFSMRLSSSF